MNIPEISIIIPVYNAEKTLKNSIDSVIGQTYENWELILVNDGSVDGSEITCMQYVQRDNRIKYIKIKNSGVATARTNGVEYATGKWIGFLDADDTIENDMMQQLLHIGTTTSAEIVQFSFNSITQKTKKVIKHKLPVNRLLQEDEIFNLILKPYTIGDLNGLASCCTKIYLKSFLDSNNLRFNANYKKGSDWLFNLKSFQHATKIAAADAVFYNYIHQNENSIMATYRKADIVRMDISIQYLLDLNNKYNLKAEQVIYKNHLLNSIAFMMRVFKHEGFCKAVFLSKKIRNKKYFRLALKQNVHSTLPRPFNIIARLLLTGLNFAAFVLLFIGAKFISK